MADRLLTWSLKSNRATFLLPTGMQGGESEIRVFESDPQMLAALPLPCVDSARYFAKARALAALPRCPDLALPDEILVAPKDKATPVAAAMRLMPGRPVEELLFPAERAALGLSWGLDEWQAVARMAAKTFAFTEHHGVTQNDTHTGNYLCDWDPRTGKPCRVVRVDSQSFGLHHGQTYFGCDRARWEYVPPELQRLGRAPGGLCGFVMPRAADRFGLACLVFECLTGCRHCDYVGDDLDAPARVERKRFAVISMPPGGTVSDEVEAAYYSLPAFVTAALERSLLGDAKSRVGPADWLKLLKPVDAPKRAFFLPTSFAAFGTIANSWSKAIASHRLAVVGTAAAAAAVWLLPPAGETVPEEGGPAAPVMATRGETGKPAAGGMPPPPRKPRDPAALHALTKPATGGTR